MFLFIFGLLLLLLFKIHEKKQKCSTIYMLNLDDKLDISFFVILNRVRR